MLRRLIAILVLVQQAAWLLVILPGHQRGAMSVAGAGSGEAACHAEVVQVNAHACCPTTLATADASAVAVAGPLASNRQAADGTSAGDAGGGHCDDAGQPAGPADPSGDPQKSDPLKKLSHCAVCHVAVRLTVAPPPVLVPAPTGLVEELAPAAPGALVSLVSLPTYDATGPPAAV